MKLPVSIKAADAVRAVPFLALILIAAVLSFRYHQILLAQRDLVEHTYQVMTSVETTFVRIIDAETGQRGFVITGDARYLRPYARALDDIPHLTADLRQLVSDSKDQLRRVEELDALLNGKLAELSETIAIRRDQGFDAARQAVLRDGGRMQMDSIRGLIDGIRGAESALLAARSASARDTERLLLLVTLVCTTLSIAARVGLALFAVYRQRVPDARADLPAGSRR